MENETFRPFKKVPQNNNNPQPQRLDNGAADFAGAVPPIVAKALKQNEMKQKDETTVQQPGFFEERPTFNPENHPSGKPVEFIQPKIQVDDKLAALLQKANSKTHVYTELQLPSLGKFYTEDIAPSNGIVHIRQMTGNEEKLLTSPKLYKKSQAINQIMKSCTKEPIKPELMLSEDRTALLIYIRGISYGANYEVEVKCPSCEQKFDYTINLDREIKGCPDDITPNSLIKNLPITNFEISYRLQNGEDENLLSEYQERRKNARDNDSFHFKASLLINYVKDLDSGIKIEDKVSIKKLIEGLPIADLDYMREFLDEDLFGIDDNIEVECYHCSYQFEIGMPMGLNFFFPFMNKRKKR